MKQTILIPVLLSLLLCSSTSAVEITPEAKSRAAALVAQMTLEEKLAYIGGKDEFYIRAIPRLGIPEIRMADGPQGVRNDTRSTLFPCGLAAASTWNRSLAYEYGRALGDDARSRGVQIMLGPGVNIYRSPLCGRNFEYMGEDPYLTSETAAQYILGMQSRGVMATIKHFCGNFQEWNRHQVSSDIDERTLNEIYLPSFRKAVTTAGVGAVMSSYNLVNSIHTTESRELIQDILRDKWGFEGIYMSDWTATFSTIGAANNGLDLEMGTAMLMTPERLRAAIETGRITVETIDQKCQHILQTLIAFGFLDETPVLEPANSSSDEVALAVAREAVVLLKNEGVLPLGRKQRNIVVMGPNSVTVPTGGGSGYVTPLHSVTFLDALRSMDKKLKVTALMPERKTDLSEWISADGQPGLKAEFYDSDAPTGEPEAHTYIQSLNYDYQGITGKSVRLSGVIRPKTSGTLTFYVDGSADSRLDINGLNYVPSRGYAYPATKNGSIKVEAGKEYALSMEYYGSLSEKLLRLSYSFSTGVNSSSVIADADAVVYCAGFDSDIEGEDHDRPWSLPEWQLAEIASACALNPHTIVVLNVGGGIDMTPFVDKAAAVLMSWYSGQFGGQALAEVLTGKINPSGRLPISLERRAEDNPTYANYNVNVPTPYNWNKPMLRVSFDEGVFVGYRGYDKSGVAPLYPFGYGLSYTDFEYSDAQLKVDGDELELTYTVKNVGKRDGAAVAQIYVGAQDAADSGDDMLSWELQGLEGKDVVRPVRELKGYEKIYLKAGEAKRVSVRLGRDAFEYYDLNLHSFAIAPGRYQISVAESSRDLRLTKSVLIL